MRPEVPPLEKARLGPSEVQRPPSPLGLDLPLVSCEVHQAEQIVEPTSFLVQTDIPNDLSGGAH